MKHFDKRLPDAELEVMKVIWENPNPISTSKVKRLIDERFPDRWTQQTLQTLINRLIAKQYLSKDKRGREYIYTAIVSEKDYVEYESELFLKKCTATLLRT